MSFLTSVAGFYRRQSPFVRRLLLGIDVGLGGYLFKDPVGAEKTVSYHLAEGAKHGTPIGTVGCAVLDKADPDHCAKAERGDQ